ncbi:MAG: glycerophosphodiester phosphodiesterase [Deltaproteobacteria bacterium]|nr:glycerophosphodiester phosphodiesterase [Deltaproteobacteria bacterium]
MACSAPPQAPSSPPASTTSSPSDAVARPRIVAHRGASHDAPENTLAAFRRAWELGVECVELDVRLTRDGEVVVIHDATTRRTAGVDRPVAEQTLAELRAHDAGRWKSEAFAGERIPTIAEAMATIPRGRTMFIEIKSGVETAPAVARAIAAADPRPRGALLALQGYDAAALSTFAAELTGAPAYWTLDPKRDEHDRSEPYPVALVAEAKRLGFAGLALDHIAVTPALLAAAREAGVIVDVWTINDAPTLAHWSGTDVRWIETDRPDLAPAR